jgi:hypothetical protein
MPVWGLLVGCVACGTVGGPGAWETGNALDAVTLQRGGDTGGLDLVSTADECHGNLRRCTPCINGMVTEP